MDEIRVAGDRNSARFRSQIFRSVYGDCHFHHVVIRLIWQVRAPSEKRRRPEATAHKTVEHHLPFYGDPKLPIDPLRTELVLQLGLTGS
ncbi:MAG: hypothetical protein GEV05_22530 [Betaproteobacteria bacterium]|nr:hypothetical protein [Betaproteobacteria bacterium]